ncbi:MAG: indolepyruvate ferredoxin oxidoreductase, partial [Polaromonas sp.]
PMLAKIKGLRGTAFDPFGYSNERRMERDLITEYEADMTEALAKLSVATHDAVVALALLPLQIRGFGPVKEANAKAAAMRRTELLAAIRAGGAPLAQAAE